MFSSQNSRIVVIIATVIIKDLWEEYTTFDGCPFKLYFNISVINTVENGGRKIKTVLFTLECFLLQVFY